MEIEIKESAGPYIGPKSGALKIKTIQVAGAHFRTDQNRKRLELGKLYSSQKDIICITLFNSSDLSYIFELILHDFEKCSQDIHCFFQVNHWLSWRQDNGDRSARTQLSRQHLARAGWGIFLNKIQKCSILHQDLNFETSRAEAEMKKKEQDHLRWI